MAREVVALSPQSVEIREVADPTPGADEVLIAAQYAAAKHGTEMAAVQGYGNRGRFDPELQLFERPAAGDGGMAAGPVRVGNMVVGTVRQVGEAVSGLRPGDRVAAHARFSDLVAVRADRCFPMVDGLSWQDAVCIDPADFALGAVRDGQLRIGDAVAVFGLGAIGLLAVQLAKLAGAHPVIGVDPLPNRRQAATTCGADATIDPTSDDAGRALKLATAKRGVDVAIEYSGSAAAMQAALRGVAFGGTVVAGAFPPPYAAGLDFGAEAHLNRPNLVFSRACSEPSRDHPRWDEQRLFEVCVRLFAAGKLSGEPLVTPVVPFESLVDAYPKISGDPGSNIKLGCFF